MINKNGVDVTDEYAKGARIALAIAKRENVHCALLKINSPSCGSKLIYDGTFTGRKVSGQGVCAELLRSHGYTVYGEDDLDAIQKLIAQSEGIPLSFNEIKR